MNLRSRQFDGAGTAWDYPEANGYGREPFASFPAGVGACVAGPNGTAVGCFAWVDPDSRIASNAYIADAFIGFVLPLANPNNLWERAFIRNSFPFSQMVVRPGVACVVASVGTFRAKFPEGGNVGSRVYADPNTGLPYAIAGAKLNPISMDDTAVTMDNASITMDETNLIPTSWVLAQSGNPGSRLLISQMVQPFN